MIKDLQNKYGKANILKSNKDGSIVVELRVDDNLADMPLDMHVNVPDEAIPGFQGYDEDHKALLVCDKDYIESIKDDRSSGDNSGDNNGEEVNVTNKDSKTTKITPDKAYEINYTIKHENGLQNSVANDFFTNKGILLEKDDKTYVQMIITEGDMVRDLKN